MSNFNIVFRNEIMTINFGELSNSQILNLCDFMKVSQFPIGFFRDIVEDRTDLTFYFSSRKRVIVTMNEVQVYSGDFSESWNNIDYYEHFHSTIRELREDDREIEDDLEELTRDIDYLDLFEGYLDEREEEDARRAVEDELDHQQVDRDIAEANARVERFDEKSHLDE